MRFPSLYDNDKITEQAGCRRSLALKGCSSEPGSSEDFAARVRKKGQYCALNLTVSLFHDMSE